MTTKQFFMRCHTMLFKPRRLSCGCHQTWSIYYLCEMHARQICPLPGDADYEP